MQCALVALHSSALSSFIAKMHVVSHVLFISYLVLAGSNGILFKA